MAHLLNRNDDATYDQLNPSGELPVNNFKKGLRDTFNLIKSPRMLQIIPFIIWTAFSLATFQGLFLTFLQATMPLTWV